MKILSKPNPKRAFPIYLLLAGVLGAALLAGCVDRTKNELQRILDAGELVVLTRNSPMTYYEGRYGFAGLEHDLVRAFAKDIGVEVRFFVPNSQEAIIDLISNQQGLNNKFDIAAAGIIVTDELSSKVRFTTSYQTIHQQLVFRFGNYPPKTIKDLYGRQIEIAADARHKERLQELKESHPKLQWKEVDDKEPEDFLKMVWDGLLEHTVIDSRILAMNKPYYPDLRVAFNIDDGEKLAWALPPKEDDSLYKAAVKFLAKAKRSGELGRLIKQYYGTAGQSNSVNMTIYQLRIQNRLPKYQTMFEEAGRKHDLDWRLLAAIGYQESFWNPLATSPTGVRGMMMLTRDTAIHLGVKDRLKADESIDGGARYIRSIIDALPKLIKEPDRTWMALASYNVGRGHLEDARIITRKLRGNPDKWSDVSQRLPLLSRASWYRKTKHGYARGIEPVRFVHRIRNYHDALVKIDEEENLTEKSKVFKLKAPSI